MSVLFLFPLVFTARFIRGFHLHGTVSLVCHSHCAIMELHPQVLPRAGKGRLASFSVSDRVSCCLVAGLPNTLNVALNTVERVSFHVLLFLHLERLICRARERALFYLTGTHTFQRPGLSSTPMFNYLQGKGHPRSQYDLFSPCCGWSVWPF